MTMLGNFSPRSMFGPLGNASNTLMLTGMGMLAGGNPQEQWRNAMGGLVAGSALDTDRRDRRKESEREKRYQSALSQLQQSGALGDMGPYSELLAADPELMRSVVSDRLSPQQTQPQLGTDDQRELEAINRERQAAGMPPYRLDEWITTRAKAGATGIQLPAEVGARIGLGDQFVTEAPAIRKAIEEGAASGFWDRAQLAAGVGAPMEVWRRMETGKEALVRNLTGAGMAQAEAENQAARYSINPWKDRKEDMLLKLEGLMRDLEATKQGAIGARSGAYGEVPPVVDPALDPLGIR